MSLQGEAQPGDPGSLTENPSSVSPNQGQLDLGEVPKDAMLLSTPPHSRASAGDLVQGLDPVCVKNDFRSMNNPTDNGAHSVSKGPEFTASPCPRISENQPEENYYSSSDSSLLTPGSQEENQGRESLTKQNTRDSQDQDDGPLPGMVDKGSPVLCKNHFDVTSLDELAHLGMSQLLEGYLATTILRRAS